MNARARTWLPVLALLFELCATTSAKAADYVVDGLKLGDRIPFDSPNYLSYACKPSDNFENFKWCNRSQTRTANGRNYVAYSSILHDAEGAAVYLMTNVAPVALNKKSIENEIKVLSKEMKAEPSRVDWSPPGEGLPSSVIASWGQVKLYELDAEAIELVAAGKSHGIGVLVDSLGDLQRSAKQSLPVYRIGGGTGYLYAASFDAKGFGHRHYVAINAAIFTARKFTSDLQEILKKDQLLASNDYSLWPDVAKITRKFALDASPSLANETLDKVFEKFPSKKLRSHAWSILPGGVIEALEERVYRTLDTYGPDTEHPEVRSNTLNFLAAEPKDPFVEFQFYVVGEFEKALKANPNSIIKDVLHYAIGHKIVASLADDAMKAIKARYPQNISDPYDIDNTIKFLNRNPALYDHKPLTSLVPDFSSRAKTAQEHFKAVLSNALSPQADDAAYMLGWLAFHQGLAEEARAYFTQAMTVGNGDYKRPAAMKQFVRYLEQLPQSQQFAIVESNKALTEEPALWYAVARSAYRESNYQLAIDLAERALKAFKLPPDRLPVTTNPEEIDAEIERLNPELFDDANVKELPYLIVAAKEILRYQTYLKSAAAERPGDLTKATRAIIIKYSKLLDAEDEGDKERKPSELAHRDLRQALHLVNMTLAAVPASAQYVALREWLYYRKIRIAGVFAPTTVSTTVSAMEAELPKSQLLDDALAEQLYTEGIVIRDLAASRKTFQKISGNEVKGNAIDNAYTWMAIIFRCQGKSQDAQAINKEIIRRFPLTRHAGYARERMANPKSEACTLDPILYE